MTSTTIPDYRIGATSGSMTATTTLLSDTGAIPNASVPRRDRYTAMDGSEKERGWLSCEWRFAALSQAQITTLRSLCAGVSAALYIKTYDGEGAYKTYSAVMVWNENPQPKADYLMDFVVTFRKMIAQ